MFESGSSIDEVLRRLSALMEDAGCPPVGLLVCGGAALNVVGVIQRGTRDIDVICVVEDVGGDVRFVKSDKLPFDLPRLVDDVARDLGLPMVDRKGNPLPDDQKWLNLGPHRLLEFGLPEGIENRLTKKQYHRCLTVYFIGREDQIFLKLYACLISYREAVHTQDLYKIDPTEDEMRAAVAWLTVRSITDQHRKKLREVLWDFSYVHIADEFGL